MCQQERAIESDIPQIESRDWPTDRELKNTYSAKIHRLEVRVGDLRTQRADLAYYMQRLLESLDTERPNREQRITDARKTLTTIREAMETE